jgi:ketosteroid isomerase-like protein
MSYEKQFTGEKAVIEEVIHNSIGWAVTKDKELSYSCFAKDSNLFFYNPDNSSVIGFESFKNLTENFFMLPDFKAIGHEIRELRINLSKSGDVAWYSARLDDRNEWKGQPANWIDVRWTGVLEKRDGKWEIVQMHFSFPQMPQVKESVETDSTEQEG